jgi:ureidoacrylate peracid hydrolase
MYRFPEIRPSTTALLVIDMQVVFVEAGQPGYGPSAPAIIPGINRLIGDVRAAGGLVVFTRHTVADAGPQAIPEWQRERPMMAGLLASFRPGLRAHDIDGRMDRGDDDLVLDKYRLSAFAVHSSDLGEHLQRRGIDTVIVTGVVTNACCETTARDAFMLGYKTFFISDGTAAFTDEEHNATLLSMSTIFADVRDTASMSALLQGAVAAPGSP